MRRSPSPSLCLLVRGKRHVAPSRTKNPRATPGTADAASSAFLWRRGSEIDRRRPRRRRAPRRVVPPRHLVRDSPGRARDARCRGRLHQAVCARVQPSDRPALEYLCARIRLALHCAPALPARAFSNAPCAAPSTRKTAVGLCASTARCFTARARPRPLSPTSCVGCFNPRPREGGDARCVMALRWWACFNPRPREGGDVSRAVEAGRHVLFQSAPPRRGRRAVRGLDAPAAEVSIRAPAKGATSECSGTMLTSTRFQSAPPRRGRPGTPNHRRAITSFQSAPPRRGRRVRSADGSGGHRVSIRAPAKGATRAWPAGQLG